MNPMNPPRHPLSALLLCGLLLLIRNSPAQAGSATWSANPINGDWNTAANWTPNFVPNGPSDTATFDVSNLTDISFSDTTQVEGIVFNTGASPFTITCTKRLTIVGPGITNNSAATQNFLPHKQPSRLQFTHSATAGSGTVFTNNGGYLEFDDTASAGSATFITESSDALTIFFDEATADKGTFITNSDGTTIPGRGATATFINNLGGTTFFGIDDRAEHATLIANGGQIVFSQFSYGNKARVELFHGLLYTADSYHLTLGSIEGDGTIQLGDYGFKVGNNNLSTVFSGQIRDDNSEIGGGTLIKEGSGTLTLSSNNVYKNGTVVLDGTLIVANGSASATGPGPVNVNGGTLGGTGNIAGAVIVGTGSGSGAILDPGNGTIPANLKIQKSLTLHVDATCTFLINSNTPASDQITARKIRIRNASVLFEDVGTSLLPSGTTLTVINNTATTRIKGAFGNLADGSTITIGLNTFQANYEGGDGNDLTLTVVP